ncbi:glutaredoxin family protein [Cellulomonas triticagri]|uniref:Glutaredoxin family protein n=2 Tax=Cellulomonas triticagri TaxID=2483352 RepID=A0A3M2JSQ7_9CELL|nr:glutaredoxin family protein [Cellulomonas triticagri]
MYSAAYPRDALEPDRGPESEAEPERVRVYSAPHCPQCAATVRTLTKAGVPFDKIDLGDLDDGERARVTAGHTTAPVVVAPGVGTWSGHRPTRLEALTAQHATKPSAGGPGGPA